MYTIFVRLSVLFQKETFVTFYHLDTNYVKVPFSFHHFQEMETYECQLYAERNDFH